MEYTPAHQRAAFYSFAETPISTTQHQDLSKNEQGDSVDFGGVSQGHGSGFTSIYVNNEPNSVRENALGQIPQVYMETANSSGTSQDTRAGSESWPTGQIGSSAEFGNQFGNAARAHQSFGTSLPQQPRLIIPSSQDLVMPKQAPARQSTASSLAPAMPANLPVLSFPAGGPTNALNGELFRGMQQGYAVQQNMVPMQLPPQNPTPFPMPPAQFQVGPSAHGHGFSEGAVVRPPVNFAGMPGASVGQMGQPPSMNFAGMPGPNPEVNAAMNFQFARPMGPDQFQNAQPMNMALASDAERSAHYLDANARRFGLNPMGPTVPRFQETSNEAMRMLQIQAGSQGRRVGSRRHQSSVRAGFRPQ